MQMGLVIFQGVGLCLRGPWGRWFTSLPAPHPLTCVNELGLSLECSIELCPTP